MAVRDLTAERLREILHYDPLEGIFTWRAGPCCGERAGGIRHGGYRHINIKRARWMEHRLAWLYVTGELPPELIDHINGVRNDNRFANLRACNFSENQQNLKKALSTSKTGLLGVTQVVDRHGNLRWSSDIQVDGGRRRLGWFATPELAHEAYLTAKRKVHPFCTI